RREGARGRHATWWLLGLLGLLAMSVVALVLYLQTFETEEDQRRQTADAQWLEQSARFHFRRLEDDLQVLAHRNRDLSPSDPVALADDIRAGLLMRGPGVVLAHGWLPADAVDELATVIERQLKVDSTQQQGNVEVLD